MQHLRSLTVGTVRLCLIQSGHIHCLVGLAACDFTNHVFNWHARELVKSRFENQIPNEEPTHESETISVHRVSEKNTHSYC